MAGGFFSSLLGRQRSNVALSETFWPDMVQMSRAGRSVTMQTALEATAVLACVRVLMEGVAQVPWKVFRQAGDDRNPAPEYPLYQVLHRRANEWQTSFEFRETLVMHTALAGNFFAFKNVVRGQVRELIPIDPGCVTVKRDSRGVLTYHIIGLDGSQREFPASAIWHVRGPSWNSWMGLEAVSLAREAIGLSLATEEAHALMHANGGAASGTYSVDGTLSPEQHKQLTEWVKKHISGSNRHSPLILDRGAKWHQLSMSGVDSQHLETRKFQVSEVCRAFRVMPIMVGESDKASTYASAEQMFLAHVVHTLMPWYERIEQSADVNLISEADERQGYYTKFMPNGLMRGAAKDRGEFYYRLWQMGAINANEMRSFEEMNPYDGGEVYRVPVNMAPTDAQQEEPASGSGDNAPQFAPRMPI